jgi:GNAT superfamily N-acetyltransferase
VLVERKLPITGKLWFPGCLIRLDDSTWTAAPICYLEDLFVDPNYCNRGLGRLLIQDLVDLAKMRGWARLYWHTQVTNPARRLYDEFAGPDDFVRYRLTFSNEW